MWKKAMISRIVLGAGLALAVSTGAFAQSYTAPAGIPSTTAPGGLEGRSAATATYGDRYAQPGFAASREDGPATSSVRAARERRAR
jgi:hypothetical protein